jgi:hypothetical protein
MSGCTNCGGKSGCDDRKGPMMASIDSMMESMYPTKTWGECTAPPIAGSAHDPDMLNGLTEELAAELNAAAFVRTGNDDEPCDYIYILCIGRPPCMVQMRDNLVPVEALPGLDDKPRLEMYLRLVISHRANVCAVQQVAMQMESSDRGHNGVLIRESPRAGVYDAPLLARMQKLVAIVPAYDLMHIDFGEISHAPPGFSPGVWSQQFAGKPSVANYLFYPQPTTMISSTWLHG